MSDIAAEAAASWGDVRALRRVAQRENEVFRADLAGHGAVALRLHRVGYRDAAHIEAELEAMSALAGAGVRCPAPLRTRAGAWLATAPDGRLASCIAWVDGCPMAPEAGAFRALGRAVARFHVAADATLSARAVARFPRWDAEALIGDAPRWGRFWESPALSPPERRRLEAVRDALRQRLAALAPGATGLIHADLLADNVLCGPGGGVWLIDFDDCGIGYRGYDLGTALVSHVARPDFPSLRAALLDGYAEIPGATPPDPADLAAFVLLRAVASCGWAASRTAAGDPRRRAYAERALALAEGWGASAL